MSNCCTPDGSCSTSAASTTTDVADALTTVYEVTGMTCSHCESSVTKAVGDLRGILGVNVDVTSGRVSVTTDGEPDDTEVSKAIHEAGYQVTGRAV